VGTAGAPSWAWAADADGTGTGAYRHAADWIGWSINGTRKVLLNATQFNLQTAVDLRLQGAGIVYNSTQVLDLGTACTAPTGGTGDVCSAGHLQLQSGLTVSAGTGAFAAGVNVGVAGVDGLVFDFAATYGTLGVRVADDGVKMFVGAGDGTGNRVFQFADSANKAKDHDKDTLHLNPTVYFNSATDPDSDNTQWGSLAHDQTDFVITTGKGAVKIAGNLEVTGTISATGTPTFKSFSHSTGNADTHYMAGWYQAPGTEAVLTQGATTQTYGAANNSYAAHAFFVAKGDGATDGSDLVVTVSGISITDAGVRNGADSEVIIGAGAAITGCENGGIIANLATDSYCETQKKWLGQLTFTLSSTAGGTFNISGNYGLAKYEDFGNRVFVLTDTECVWSVGANETNFDLTVLHHDANNWTYSAAAFEPGLVGAAIADLDTDHSTDDEFDSGEFGSYKRAALAHAVDGSAQEGVIIKFTHAVNNSIEHMDCHLGATF